MLSCRGLRNLPGIAEKKKKYNSNTNFLIAKSYPPRLVYSSNVHQSLASQQRLVSTAAAAATSLCTAHRAVRYCSNEKSWVCNLHNPASSGQLRMVSGVGEPFSPDGIPNRPCSCPNGITQEPQELLHSWLTRSPLPLRRQPAAKLQTGWTPRTSRASSSARYRRFATGSRASLVLDFRLRRAGITCISAMHAPGYV